MNSPARNYAQSFERVSDMGNALNASNTGICWLFLLFTRGCWVTEVLLSRSRVDFANRMAVRWPEFLVAGSRSHAHGRRGSLGAGCVREIW